MKFALLIALILAHLAGPGLAECPVVTEVQALRQRLEQRVKRAEAIELWAVRHGVKITIDGWVWHDRFFNDYDWSAPLCRSARP